MRNATRRNRNSSFGQGSGVYTCTMCGKQTRETGSSESAVDMCLACYNEAGLENEHSDGYHRDAPVAGCPYCEAAAAAVAAPVVDVAAVQAKVEAARAKVEAARAKRDASWRNVRRLRAQLDAAVAASDAADRDYAAAVAAAEEVAR